MVKCIAPNCHSGYTSNDEGGKKIHMLKVPKDRVKEFQIAIKRKNFTVKSHHYVCHKHFLESDLKWAREVKDPFTGKVMASEPYKIPRLREGALPSQFPNCPKYLSKTVKKRKSPKKRNLINANGPPKKKPKMIENIEIQRNDDSAKEVLLDSDPTKENLILPKNIPDIPPDIPAHPSCSIQEEPIFLSTDSNTVDDEISRRDMFKSLFENKDSFKIPISWNQNNMYDGNFRAIIFVHWEGEMKNNVFSTKSAKKIVLFEDMTIHASVMDISLENSKLNFAKEFVTCAEDINSIVESFHKLKTCGGIASPSYIQKSENSFAFTDTLGHLRHNNCTLVLEPNTNTKTQCCSDCKKSKLNLAKKESMKKKSTDFQRIVFKNNVDNSKIKYLRSKLKNIANKCAYNAKSKILLKKRIHDAKMELSKINKELLESELEKRNISSNEKLVITEMLKASKCKGKRGHRYSDEWIILCLIFHMKSPATYNLLREQKVLPLPCTSTIKRYLSLIETPCGFHSQMFELLEEKLKSLPEEKRHFIISLDEMKTRKNVTLNSKTFELNGLSDFGDGSQKTMDDQADHGLVILLQPVMDDYTQPIAVFTSKGPVTGLILAKLLIEAIILLEKVDAKVHGIVADGASTNRKFWTELGVCGELNKVKSSFPHPSIADREVFVFSDPPHLIKCVRNRLFERKELRIDPNLDSIKWSFFEKLFEVDMANLEGRLCPKLKYDHIYPNKMLKMRVFLAVQILSTSVAKGLLYYKDSKKFAENFKGCELTAEFCLRFDQLFDAMNRTRPEEANKFQNADLKVFNDFLSWLDSWESKIVRKKVKEIDKSFNLVADDFLTKSTSEGLRVTIHSFLAMRKTVIETFKLEYLLTGKINQDPLERFFGTIRCSGGTNDHPCTPTFLQLYKILAAFSILKPPKSGNCSVFDANPPKPLITLTKLKELFHQKTTNAFQEIKEKLQIAIDNEDSDFSDFVHVINHDYELPEIRDCILFYTVSCACKLIKKRVTCSKCLNAFFSVSETSIDQDSFTTDKLPLTFSKFPDTSQELVHPNAVLYRLLSEVECHFQKLYKNKNAFHLIFEEIAKEERKIKFTCNDHIDEAKNILSLIIKNYIEIRMRQTIRKNKSEVRKQSVLKRKEAKLCNI